MAKLQILVNHYNEDGDTVRRFLSSLDSQSYRDFSVMILGDGGRDLSRGELAGHAYVIEYAYKPHTGVCNTRNVMLDRATTEFVMLCDVDDYFSADGLGLLMAKSDGMDIVGSTYISEGPNGQTRKMEKDVIRLHGKILRRQYLVDNEIRFPDEMETSGDMAFLWLAFALTNKVTWIDDVFYTWANNPTSVTRSDPYFHVSHYDRTLMCYRLLGRDLIRRKRKDLLMNMVATLFGMIYVDVTSPEWNLYPKDLRDSADRHIRDCVGEFMDVYRRIPERYRHEKYELMRDYKGGKCASFDGMMEFVERYVSGEGVLIVGCGVVGANLCEEIHALGPMAYDKYKGEDYRKGRYHIAFICVDTPYTEDDPCDITEVENALMENDADIYVIKSTVLPGTTKQLSKLTGKRIVFSPEYYGGTQHANASDYNFTILGGDKDDCIEVVQLLQDVYDGSHQFKITDSTTAELAKYMENCWIATKVSFCNQFARIAGQYGVYYEELRELFLLDPRVSPSHTYSYRSHPFWDSHCLNKDVPAIAETADAPLLKAVIKYNDECKQCHSV